MVVVGCEQPHAMSSLFLSSARESLAIERTSEPISSGLFTMHPDTPAARSASTRRQASRVQAERIWAGSHRVRSVFVARRWSGLCCPPQACRRHSSYPCTTPDRIELRAPPVDIQIEIREGADGPPSEAQELPITSSENIEPKFDPMSCPVRHRFPVRNDIAAILRRMQPRWQRYRGGSQRPPWNMCTTAPDTSL